MMLTLLADALMIATRQSPYQPTHEAHRLAPRKEENRRRSWALLSGIRF